MKKNLLFYFFILIILFFACQEKKPATTSITTKIDQLVNRYLTLGRFSGAILVANGNEILFNQSYGLADYTSAKSFTKNTTFKIGTLTKFFTAYIIRQMAKEGKINLRLPLSTYLVNFEGTHTIQNILDNQYNPEKMGYIQLGQLIEKQLKSTYQEAIEQYFSPLGMQQTYYQKEDSNLAQGHLFHNYRGKGLELEVAPSYVDSIAFSNYGLKASVHDLWKLSLELKGVNINESGYLEEDGFSYTFEKDTSTNLIIIILSNRRHPVSGEIRNSIKAIYQKTPYTLPLLRTPFINNTDLYEKYTGTYKVNPNFAFEVMQRNDSLFTIMGDQETPIIPQSDHQFYYQQVDAAIRFVRDSNQVFSQAILYNGFLEGQIVNKKQKNLPKNKKTEK